jgi:hypothetical protein
MNKEIQALAVAAGANLLLLYLTGLRRRELMATPPQTPKRGIDRAMDVSSEAMAFAMLSFLCLPTIVISFPESRSNHPIIGPVLTTSRP